MSRSSHRMMFLIFGPQQILPANISLLTLYSIETLNLSVVQKSHSGAKNLTDVHVGLHVCTHRSLSNANLLLVLFFSESSQKTSNVEVASTQKNLPKWRITSATRCLRRLLRMQNLSRRRKLSLNTVPGAHGRRARTRAIRWRKRRCDQGFLLGCCCNVLCLLQCQSHTPVTCIGMLIELVFRNCRYV